MANYKFQFGFEVEQAGLLSDGTGFRKLRNLTRENRGPLKEYCGHNDCEQWEVATHKPASYGITIKQLDMLFYSSLLIGSDGVKKYKSPFTWKNFNSGCHVHISLNYNELSKVLKSNVSVTVKRKALKNYLRDYMNLFNFCIFFDIPMRSFMYFRDPVRGVRDNVGHGGVYFWGNVTKPFHKDEFLRECRTHGMSGQGNHAYISPCPRWWNLSELFRDVPEFRNERFKLNPSDSRCIIRIPKTIEFRANENFYFFVGELLRRFSNLSIPFLKICADSDYWCNFKADGSFNGLWKKMLEFREKHGVQGMNFFEAAKEVKDIDLCKARDSRAKLFRKPALNELLFTSKGKSKTKFCKKYPSYAHFIVDFYRNLGMFGSKYREIVYLYMHQPCWKSNDHHMIWYLRKCLTKGMKIKRYVEYAARGQSMSFDNQIFVTPVIRVKPNQVPVYMKESREMDREYS